MDEHYGTILYLNPILLILLFIIVLVIFKLILGKSGCKKYFYEILVSGLAVITWETLIEYFGWKFGFWDFMKLEIEPMIVLVNAFITSLFFCCCSFNLSIVFILLIEKKKKGSITSLLLFLIFGGLLIDILGGFSTYLTTLIIWSSGFLIYYFTLYFQVKYYAKKIGIYTINQLFRIMIVSVLNIGILVILLE
jgi:hypothetical protein